VTEFQDGTLIAMEVMGCQVATCNRKGYKTPFHRSGHKWSFNVNMNTFPRFYKTFICPVLEYANWGPTFLTDQRYLEKVQKWTARMVPKLCILSYTEHLHHLNLLSLFYWRRRGDMIFVYQLFHNYFNIDTSVFYIPATVLYTRGHIISFSNHIPTA